MNENLLLQRTNRGADFVGWLPSSEPFGIATLLQKWLARATVWYQEIDLHAESFARSTLRPPRRCWGKGGGVCFVQPHRPYHDSLTQTLGDQCAACYSFATCPWQKRNTRDIRASIASDGLSRSCSQSKLIPTTSDTRLFHS